MSRIIYLSSIFFLIVSGFSLSQNFRTPILVKDACAHSKVIWLGVDPNGTEGFDIGIDSLAPPLPPGGFDVRYRWSGENYFTDVRDNNINEKQFQMYYQFDAACAPIKLYWDKTHLDSLGTFSIFDNITGNLWGPFDMTATDSLIISPDLVFIQNSLRILVTPYPYVSANLSIENQHAIGADFFFDIYLTSTGTEDIYLGAADFSLTFNVDAFINPTLNKEVSTFWNLISTNGNQVGEFYYSATTPSAITSNEIIIHLDEVSFQNQQEFNDNIARINDLPVTHRIGRYKVSTIINFSDFMELQWKTTGEESTTEVFTFTPIYPPKSRRININAINPTNAPLPVELKSFTAIASGDKVELKWETKTEVNNYGFDVQRLISNTSENNDWHSIGFVQGHGNCNAPRKYHFIDNNPYGGNRFLYRLKQIDTDGQFEYSKEVEVAFQLNEYQVFQNYPNPFNPLTSIKFSLPEDSYVSIKVYDVLGSFIDEIISEKYPAGYHIVSYDASARASGLYIYKFEATQFVEVKKMIFMK